MPDLSTMTLQEQRTYWIECLSRAKGDTCARLLLLGKIKQVEHAIKEGKENE